MPAGAGRRHRHAQRAAKALKTVSHWWCALRPLEVVDVQADAGVIDETLEEFMRTRAGCPAPDHAAR